LDDLRLIAERRHEKTIPHAELKRRLKWHGLSHRGAQIYQQRPAAAGSSAGKNGPGHRGRWDRTLFRLAQ
jgi:hypothetical protein